MSDLRAFAVDAKKITVTVRNATALAVGIDGNTDPAFAVDTSTALSTTGLKVKSAVAGAGVALSAVSSGTSESVTIDAKGAGNVSIGSISTGSVVLGGAASGSVTVNQDLVLADGKDIVLGTTVGSALGTSAEQMLAFYGATPVVQQTVNASIVDNTGGMSAAAPSIGTAGNYLVLGATGVAVTGPTAIAGNIGSFPTASITGSGNIAFSGGGAVDNAGAQQAQTDLTAAYAAAAAATSTNTPIGGTLGGLTLTAGVYTSATSLALTGTLTLTGSASDVFIFQAGTTLTTASTSAVVLSGGAVPSNVFWQIGSSATLGATSTFRGILMAQAGIIVSTGTTVAGRLLARTGAVTLDTTIITVPAGSVAPATPQFVLNPITNAANAGSADYRPVADGLSKLATQINDIRAILVSLGLTA